MNVYFYLLFLLLISQFFNIAPSGAWHDSHRLFQILFFCIISLYFFWCRNIEKQIVWAVIAVLIFGLLSALGSQYPQWSLMEVALWVCCIMVFSYFSKVARENSFQDCWRFLIISLCACSALMIFRFFVSYVTHLAVNNFQINVHDLISGFDNPRFFGQFATMALCVLGVAIYKNSFSRKNITLNFIFILLWILVIATGTRGTWLAIGVISLFLLPFGRSGTMWSLQQAKGAAFGIIGTYFLFSFIPKKMGFLIVNHAAERLNTSLSLREIIWNQAIEMAIAHPWLGAGPMHFAALRSVAGAHPHQMILQWSAEWGIPFALIVLAIVFYVFYSFFFYMRHHGNDINSMHLSYIGLMTAVMAALVQSMVDGVFVMPYTQLWLSVLAGLAYGLHQKQRGTSQKYYALWMEKIICAVFIGCAFFLAIVAIPSMQKASDLYIAAEGIKPRFWIYGFISAP